MQVGDTIQIAGTEVEISCALSQGLFGDDLIVICSQETFDRLMGQEKYGLIGVQLSKDATDETVAQIRRLENNDIVITDNGKDNPDEQHNLLGIKDCLLWIFGYYCDHYFI